MSSLLTEWYNTGGNGRAKAVWVRRIGEREAHIHVMPYRYMVQSWQGSAMSEDGIPFETLTEAKAYADQFLNNP